MWTHSPLDLDHLLFQQWLGEIVSFVSFSTLLLHSLLLSLVGLQSSFPILLWNHLSLCRMIFVLFHMHQVLRVFFEKLRISQDLGLLKNQKLKFHYKCSLSHWNTLHTYRSSCRDLACYLEAYPMNTYLLYILDQFHCH